MNQNNITVDNLKIRINEYAPLGFCLTTENDEFMIRMENGGLHLYFVNPDYDNDPNGTYSWTGDVFYSLEDIINEINDLDLKYLQEIHYNANE